MKKYVSKQDVEKGLVDPTKPLNQQKDYLQKMEKEERQKHPNKQKQKPEYHYKRKQRPNKVKYNWNRRDVVESTPVPQAPKKQVPKPDKTKFLDQLDAFKKQIQQLNKKKSEFIHELGSAIRNKSDNKKTSNTIKSKYSTALNEKHNIKKSLQDQMRLLEQKRDEVERQLNSVKQKANSLKKPESFEDCSTQQLQRRLQKIETRLTTGDLDKKQQNRINMKIQQIKRAIQKSRPDVQINGEIKKLQDQNDLLFRQLKQIKGQISDKYNQLKQIKGEITVLNQDKSKQKVQPEDSRTIQQIKADYQKRIQQINSDKDKVKAKIDKLRQKFDKDQDQYEDYNDLVSYIKMVNQQKQKIKKWRQDQQRRKKQKEQQQKERQKKMQELQKRKQEKQQKDEQRRKAAQQRRQKLQKQRQQYINRNPHHEKIQVCQSLIEYCQALKPQNASRRLQKRQEKVIQPITDLKTTDNKQWQKELKKGAQVIVSKKLSKQDQAPSNKKVVKQKKKKQVPENASGFTHHMQTTLMFEKVNLIPPLTAADIDQTIKQLNERVQLFNKPTEQQISAYKVRAEKQFDERHHLSDRYDNHDREDRGERGNRGERGDRNRGKPQNYRAKQDNEHQHKAYQQKTEDKQTRAQKPKNKRANKQQVVAKQTDFPGLD